MAAQCRSALPDHRASKGARHVTFLRTCGALKLARQDLLEARIEGFGSSNPMQRSVYLFLDRAAIWLVCTLSLFANSSYAAPAEIVSRMGNVDGVQIHYLTAGHGPPVLLFHGYAETSRMWRPIIPLLAEKFTV